MRVIQRPEPAGERVVALGTFDGVHLGHRALLHTAAAYAGEHGIPLRVCTFNRHPLELLCPEVAPPLLTTIPEKAQQMARLGVQEMELLNFDHRMAEKEPEAFLEELRSAVKLRAVVAGWNYTFGKKGRGNAELLREDGQRHGYDVLIVQPTVTEDGTPISSSLVRHLLQAGEIETVEVLLGHSYTISGRVVQGKKMGKRIGFPTANVAPFPKKALPEYGVYTCLIETAKDVFPGIVNIGVQPTMPSGRVTVEAHALCGNPELYGLRVRLSLRKMLRTEKRFDTVDELKQQIIKDCGTAMEFFHMA